MASTHNLQASKLFSVKDYVCVVTGGGSGIGLMAAQALAANGKSLASLQIGFSLISDRRCKGVHYKSTPGSS